LSSIAHNKNGFTLIEVLIALMIFAFGLLSIAGLQVNAISYDSAANHRTAITMLTQGIMEEIMAFPDDNSYTLTEGHTYSASVIITPDTPVDSMTQIEVTETSENDRTLTLTSFKRMG
jgi:type IV pilus assembly protein PilV